MYMATKSDSIFVTEDGVRRQLEGEELAEFLFQRDKDLADKAAKLAELEQKQLAKNALLERLGITAEEAKLLLS